MIKVAIKTKSIGVITTDEIKEFETIELANQYVRIFNEAAFYSETPDGGTYAEIQK